MFEIDVCEKIQGILKENCELRKNNFNLTIQSPVHLLPFCPAIYFMYFIATFFFNHSSV